MRTALRVLRPVYKLDRKARGVLVFAIVFGFFWLHVYGHINWWSFIGLWILAYNFVFLPEAITSYCEVNGVYRNPQQAIEYCRWALELDPVNEVAMLHLANCYITLDMSADAIFVLNKAINHEPKNADLYYRRALIHYQNSNLKRLIADSEKMKELAPNKDVTKYIESAKLILQGNYEKAFLLLDKTSMPAFDKITLDYWKFYCLVQMNQTDLAREFVAQYKGTPQNGLFVATLAFHKGDYVDALSEASNFNTNKQTSVDISSIRAAALILLGEPGMVYKMAADLLRRTGPGTKCSGALLFLTVSCFAHIDDLAFTAINFMRSQGEDSLICDQYEVWIYLRRGQLEEASEIIENWERLQYVGESYYNYKSLLLTKQGERLEEALALAEKSFQYWPNSLDTNVAMGAALSAMGNYQKAIDILKDFTDRTPVAFEAFKFLAKAYELNGDQTIAEETARKGANLLKLYQDELRQAMEEMPCDLTTTQAVALNALPAA